MLDVIVGLTVLMAAWPLTMFAVRHAKKHRGHAMALATLMLVFGVNVHAAPLPPPRVEASEHEEEKAGDDEPK